MLNTYGKELTRYDLTRILRAKVDCLAEQRKGCKCQDNEDGDCHLIYEQGLIMEYNASLIEAINCMEKVDKLEKVLKELEQYGAIEQETGNKEIAGIILQILNILEFKNESTEEEEAEHGE